jgi:hypothetical protein
MLTPLPRHQYHGAEILADFERQGLLRRAQHDKQAIDDLPAETPLTGVLAALLEERSKGR